MGVNEIELENSNKSAALRPAPEVGPEGQNRLISCG